MCKKLLSLSVIVCFISTSLYPVPKAHADTILDLPAPGTMINLSPAYEPVMIKGLTIHKDNPFLFDFIVDIGQDRMSGEPLKKEGEKLIKYFLASLAIPDKDVWVNLSPYEKAKMIPEALGQTDMGRDLLEQDYILKQITASLIYPEKQLGKTFWNRVYTKAQEMYGTTQIPVNTFNKVWIMADRAEVFEHNQTAFVVDQHLKVMLEEDYLALTHHSPVRTHTIASQVVKQVILPELEKEVNTGKNFANLRQIFNSIILSSWYKRNLKEALLNQLYADKAQVKGINLNDPAIKQQIYQQYLKAYKKGVFNYIKEDVNTASGEAMPRKYFSGGINPGKASVSELTVTTDSAMGARDISHQQFFGEVDFATLATTQFMNPNAGKLPKSTRKAIQQFRVIDLSVATSIPRTNLRKDAGRALKARILQLQTQGSDNAMAVGTLEYRFGDKTYRGSDVLALSDRILDYRVILNAFRQWANNQYNPAVYNGKKKFTWTPVDNTHFFSKGAASIQEAVIARYPIEGVTRDLTNNFIFYLQLPKEALKARISAAMRQLDQDRARIYALQTTADAAMVAKPTLEDVIASSYIEAESILHQLMFPDLNLVYFYNKNDANAQAQSLLRTIVRTGAARVLADYIGQEGIDLQDTQVRDQIMDLLSVIRGKIFSNGSYAPANEFSTEMDALKEANRLLRQAAEKNNPKERQAIVSLALDRLYAINNPPVNTLREFLKAHASLTKSWSLVSGLLTQADQYIRVHDAAMIAQPVTGFEITPELAQAFDEKVGNFTAFGRPTAGKDTLMPIVIEKLNKLLPGGNQIVTVSTGEYVAGIIRLVKNKYTEQQADLRKSDEEKYGAYTQLLDDQDRADMESGRLVRDEKMYRIINRIFEEPGIANARHIFFNGFPRNLSQWNAIQEGKILLRGKPLTIDFFLDINLPREATFARAEKRTEDRLRQGLSPRPDDNPKTVADRQNEFDSNTKPMVDDIAAENAGSFRRISSYFPDDTFDESLRKTSDQFIRALHDYLGLPMHYDNYQQLYEAAEQGAFETKKYFYIRTTDSAASKEVMVSNVGDDWISGYEVGPAGVVRVGQGIVVIHKDEFAQAQEADAAMTAVSARVYDNYGQMFNDEQRGAFKYIKFVDITYKENGLDQKARIRVSDIGGVWSDGFKIDESRGIETQRVRISNDNFIQAQVEDAAMTARDTAEIFLENIDEGDFRPERFTDLPIYTGFYPIEEISLKPGDMVLDDTDLNQEIEPLSAGNQIKVSATNAYVFTGQDGRVIVLSGTGRGAQRTLAVVDQAALAKAPFTRGGIDLNTSRGMQWKVSRDGKGVEMIIDPALIEQVRREGIDSLTPVVLKMTPVESIWPLVGLAEPTSSY